MRVAFAAAAVMLWLGASGVAQSLPSLPSLAPAASALQHVSVIAGASVLQLPAAGGRVTLWADVIPKRGVHVYASGAKDFTPVSLVMTPRPGLTIEKPRYEASEPFLTLGATVPVPVYRAKFRITQPIVLAGVATGAQEVIVAGAVNYQACDETTCYPSASVPVLWRLPIRAQ